MLLLRKLCDSVQVPQLFQADKQRKYKVANFNVHLQDKTISWKGPLDQQCTETIRKNSLVAISPFVVHHLEKYWKNAENFDPERWISVDEASLHPCAYIPFGAGIRRCNN